VLKHLKQLGLTDITLPLLGLGAILFTWLLYRHRLVPRVVISAVGLLGDPAASISGCFSGDSSCCRRAQVRRTTWR
jgi:hypothetical protein